MLNLNNNPRKDDLRELVRNCDDQAGHHSLWVAKNGEVHLSVVPRNMTPVGFEMNEPGMQLRLETFQAGNEYVGPNAAEDEEWISQLFDTLIEKWDSAKGKQSVEYVDQF